MVDRGVVARYFLDDGSSGQLPTNARDAIADPFDLPITFDQPDDPVWFASSTGRGLTFPSPGLNGGACRSIDGKFLAMLDLVNEASLEAVVTIDACNLSGSRLVHIGDTGNWGFTIACQATSVHFSFNNRNAGDGPSWALSFSTRQVWTVVFESTRAVATERVRFYVDGVPQTMTVTSALPTDNELLDIDPIQSACIGNRPLPDGARTPQGTISYAAYYAVALSDAEIMANANRLLATDDR